MPYYSSEGIELGKENARRNAQLIREARESDQRIKKSREGELGFEGFIGLVLIILAIIGWLTA
jgi:hypothetical protein